MTETTTFDINACDCFQIGCKKSSFYFWSNVWNGFTRTVYYKHVEGKTNLFENNGEKMS